MKVMEEGGFICSMHGICMIWLCLYAYASRTCRCHSLIFAEDNGRWEQCMVCCWKSSIENVEDRGNQYHNKRLESQETDMSALSSPPARLHT
jgi:hypothetical protein